MLLSDTEKSDLIETINCLIEHYIDCNTLSYHEENFDYIINNYIRDIIEIQFEFLYDVTDKTNIDNFISETIFNYLNKKLLLRSKTTIDNSNANNANNIINNKLNFLEKYKNQEQNSDDWFVIRHKYLTASSIWKIFSTKGCVNTIIYGKCLPLNLDKYKSSNFNFDSPLHWGHKYEPLSIKYYEYKYNTEIKEYGCIPHSKFNYLAASPDGINYNKESSRYGRMLEIKNIVNRKITGIPKKEYWIQMQIQMEVCDLDECDFLETRFVEYANENEFNNDGDFNLTKDNKHKGIIIMFIDENNNPMYEYAPVNISKNEFKLWEKQTTDSHLNKNHSWFSNLYWKLEEVSCVLVDRNKKWFSAANIEIEKTWNIINKEKQDGSYILRAPKKRTKTQETSSIKKCKINLDNL